MEKRFKSKILLAFAVFLNANLSAQVHKTSWLGNTWGYGAEKKWVQNHINALYVAPNGKCYTNSFWDEAHNETSVYQNGDKIGVMKYNPYGLSVTGDVSSLFLNTGSGNTNGGSGGSISVIRFNGSKGLTISIGETDKVYDMAVKGDELYVSNPNKDNIIVYSVSTGAKLREFAFTRPSYIEVDGDNNLWIVKSSYSFAGDIPWLNPYFEPAQILCYSKDGVYQNRSITDVDFPSDLAMYPGNKLLVSDWGSKQQVRCYKNLSTTPVLDSSFFNNGTLGALYGTLSGVKGEIKDDKFYKLAGVGADSVGNVYVSLGGPVPRGDAPVAGTDLRKYNTDGTMAWRLIGKEFVAAGDLDPLTKSEFYTKDTRYDFNPNENTTGKEWLFKAFTVDNWKYPEDPMSIRMGSWLNNEKINVYARRLGGQLILFMNEQAGDQGPTDIFRFDSINDDYIHIPCGRIGHEASPIFPPNAPQGVDMEYFWSDNNHNGKYEGSEYVINLDYYYPYGNNYWPDRNGNIWKAYREQGIRKIPFLGLDNNGVPQYSLEPIISWDMPSEYRDVHNIRYIPEDDVLYVSGWATRDNYCLGRDCPGGVGTLSKYKNWSTTPTLVWMTPAADAAWLYGSQCFDVAGNYIFVVTSQGEVEVPTGSVFVYSITDGTLVTTLKPGSEVSGPGGWVDIWDGGVKAHKLPNGEYKVFAEEDMYNKTIVYTWAPDGVIDADIKITAPGNSSFILPGSDIDIKVDARHADGVNKVEFFNGNSKLGEDTSAPYSFNWTAVPIGTYHIKARLISSNLSDTVYAEISSVFVQNRNPKVIISEPFYNANVDAGQNIEISVSATDVDGTIDSVFLYANNKKIAKWLSEPYTINYIPSCGNHEFYAEAFDNSGNKAVSAITKINAIPAGKGEGKIIRELYTDISGISVFDLTNNYKYPSNHSLVDTLSNFEAPTDFLENYGQRMYAWLLPPETDDYTFWIASDDQSELWLSTDSTKKNRVKICFESNWSSPREWNDGYNKSAPISLVAGEKYYIEALHKEATVSDNLSVAWQGSCFGKSLIYGRFLSMYVDNNIVPTVSYTFPLNNSTLYTGDTITISVIADDPDGQIDSVELFVKKKKVATLLSSPYEYVINKLTRGNYTTFARAYDNKGGISNTLLNTFTVEIKPTAINDLESLDISLWPNPAKNQLNISFPAQLGKVNLDIMDIEGRLIQKIQASNGKGNFDISQLASGIYFVKISNYNTTGVQKIVVSK